jgi:hypothetical protein
MGEHSQHSLTCCYVEAHIVCQRQHRRHKRPLITHEHQAQGGDCIKADAKGQGSRGGRFHCCAPRQQHERVSLPGCCWLLLMLPPPTHTHTLSTGCWWAAVVCLSCRRSELCSTRG